MFDNLKAQIYLWAYKHFYRNITKPSRLDGFWVWVMDHTFTW